uniref:Uncharacterized protein n=1 Tax=Arundo donax TaxID=35708 RepID=A0A0A9HAU1_ARUDO
MPVLAQRGNG